MLLLVKKLLTSTEIVVGIVWIIPVDADFSVVPVPVHVRHVAILITRTRLFA